MYQNYPYDQNPSTSAPQRQVFGAPSQIPFGYRQSPANPMVRVAGGVRNAGYVNQWMNDHQSNGSVFSNFNRSYSPAPSELSCASGASLNSVMSSFSRLSINTQLSFCTNPTYQNYSFGPVSYENQPPMNTEQIENMCSLVVQQLKRHDFYQFEKEQCDLFFFNLKSLITGSMNGKSMKEIVAMKDSLPYRKINPQRRCDLLKAIFNRLKCSREEQEQMARISDQCYQLWSERSYGLLKHLLLIMSVHSDLFDEDLEIIMQQHRTNHEIANPLEVLYLLLHKPSQKFTHFAVQALYQVIYTFSEFELSRSRRLRRLRLLKPWMADDYLGHLFNALMTIIIHDDISVKPKTMAIQFACRLMTKRMAVRKVFLWKGHYQGLQNGFVFQIIQRCFQMQTEEALIHSTILLFLKMTTVVTPPPGGENENDKCLVEFLNQFTLSGGFTAITAMLNHGSPRVLTGCLTFLAILGSFTDKITVDLRETILGVLKLVCSSEPLIGQQCLRFLVNIVNNPLFKQLVTERKGPEMIVQVLCQGYKMSFDPSIDIPKMKKITDEINEHGHEILRKLLDDSNLSASEAALQLINNLQTFIHFTFHLTHYLDSTSVEILKILRRIHSLAPNRTKEIMEISNGMTLAETVASLVFAIRLYSGSSIQHIVKQIVDNAMGLIVETSKQKEIALMFATWFGKIEKDTDCPISLFGSTDNEPFLRRELLKFLDSLTSDENAPCLRDLPKIWSKHPDFEFYMREFQNSSDQDMSNCATRLLSLAFVK